MSRIAKNPITIPEKTSVDITNDILNIKGNHGEINFHIPIGFKVEKNENLISVKTKKESLKEDPKWGTLRANLANAIKGVSEGYSKKLELVGTGYKASVSGNVLKLSLGYSHEINYSIPKDVKIAVEKSTLIKISGIDKELVGKVASEIKMLKPVEPYKGKGIKERGQYVLRKEGKKK